MTARVRGALFLLLAFLLGAAAGAFGFGLYQVRTGRWHVPRDPARFQQFLLKRLTRELDLRPDQRQQVEAILREAGQEFAHLREEFGPRVREIRARSRDRIRALLDPGQQAKFETLAQEWERRAERWRERAAQPEEKPSKAP
jgi:Spy/CpxP family protein refolding chaperone